MIVSCNACSKRYLIDEMLIDNHGRPVRCAACGHAWTQFPQSLDIKLDGLDPLARGPDVKSHRKMVIIAFMGCILMAVVTGLYGMRYKIVEKWPIMRPIFEKTRLINDEPTDGLVFENLIPLQTKEREQSFLVLKGEVHNPTNTIRQLSSVKILLQGDCLSLNFFQKLASRLTEKSMPGRCIIDKWRYTLTQTRLLPGEKIRFETSPHPIHTTASEVSVEF